VSVTVPETPVLVTVPRVELVEVGRWNISNIAGWEPSTDDIAAAVASLDCPAVRRPVLKLGHVEGAGDPALGFVDNMAVAEDGMLLVGDYAGVPSWLGDTDTNGNSVLASAYADRSIEGEYGYRCQLGHTHPFVIHAVALLGVERPGVGTLQSLQDLYGTAPQTVTAKEAPMPQQVNAAATTDDVRRAYYNGPGQNWDLWIREMYVDPMELIIENDADASLSRVTYTVDADGTVTFADPQPVQVQYVAARAAASRPTQAWATHAEARPGRPPTDPPAAPAASDPAAAGGTSTEEADVPDSTLLTGLRQSLGLAEDADEATVLAAVQEALTERADPPSTPTLPEGVVTIDQSTLAELQVAARAGADARERQRADDRDRFLEDAVRAGKFAPARREHFARLYDADETGTREVVNQLAANTVPVSELGHDNGETPSTDPAAGDDYWFPGFATATTSGQEG
jgi:hypothetical protein